MPRGPTPTLLLTRPLASSRWLAGRFDGPVVISPVMRIVPLPFDRAALADAPGVVLTSAHAVPAAGPGRGRPAICVGARTAAMARRAGFRVTEGPGDAAGLLPLIAAGPPGLVHPHGRHVAQRLPVPGVAVYDQQALPLTPKARALLQGAGPVILPVFSPRSAGLVADQARDARAPLWLVAISPAAMAAWTGPADRRLLADAPSGRAMEDAIRRIARAEQS